MVFGVVDQSVGAGADSGGTAESVGEAGGFSVGCDLQGPTTKAALRAHPVAVGFIDVFAAVLAEVEGEVVIAIFSFGGAVEVFVVIRSDKEVF